MDENHVEQLRVLLADMERQERAPVRHFRSRLRAILQDSATDPQDRKFNGGAWDGVTLGTAHSLISRLVDHAARGMGALDGRTPADKHDHENARALVARVRRLPHPDRADPGPDVVQRSEVSDLPAGSLVVPCWSRDGNIKAEHAVREVKGPRGGIGGHDLFRVLYRAPEPPVKVGDVVTGKRANDLPDGTIVVSTMSTSTQFPLTKIDGRYREHKHDLQPDLLVNGWKFRVLHLGGN